MDFDRLMRHTLDLKCVAHNLTNCFSDVSDGTKYIDDGFKQEISDCVRQSIPIFVQMQRKLIYSFPKTDYMWNAMFRELLFIEEHLYLREQTIRYQTADSEEDRKDALANIACRISAIIKSEPVLNTIDLMKWVERLGVCRIPRLQKFFLNGTTIHKLMQLHKCLKVECFPSFHLNVAMALIAFVTDPKFEFLPDNNIPSVDDWLKKFEYVVRRTHRTNDASLSLRTLLYDDSVSVDDLVKTLRGQHPLFPMFVHEWSEWYDEFIVDSVIPARFLKNEELAQSLKTSNECVTARFKSKIIQAFSFGEFHLSDLKNKEFRASVKNSIDMYVSIKRFSNTYNDDVKSLEKNTELILSKYN
jgi:hypothetical protein